MRLRTKLLCGAMVAFLAAPFGNVAHASTVSFTNFLTPATPGALDTCVGQNTCNLGFGELTVGGWNSTILPASFSQIGVALAPPNGVAYVGVGAGPLYQAGGFAFIDMFRNDVTSFRYDIGSVDSFQFDGTVNSVVAFTSDGGHIGVDGQETLLAFNTHPASGVGSRNGEVVITPTPGIFITSVQFFANHNSLEADNFGVTETKTVTTPEASTWLMMAMGFIGLGYIGMRKRKERFATI